MNAMSCFTVSFGTHSGCQLTVTLFAPDPGTALRSLDEIFGIDLARPGILVGPGITRRWSPVKEQQQ